MNADLDRVLNPFRYDSDGNPTEAALRHDSAQRRAPGGGEALRVSPASLRARADACDAVAARFEQECVKPLSSTGVAGNGMKGFRCAGAFSVLESRWRAQVRHTGAGLMGTFARDLRDGARQLGTADADTARAFA